MEIFVWRIYEKPIPDGYRILVDALWPRGIRREEIDHWAKEIAPSAELRKWFSHDPERWNQFLERYENELRNNPALNSFIDLLRKIDGNAIFLYAAKEKNYNNANALKQIIEKML